MDFLGPPNSSSSLSEEIDQSRRRLKAAWESEEANAEAECPIEGRDDIPPHSGKCCQCSTKEMHVAHNIPRDEEALQEAVKLQEILAKSEHIGHPDAKIGNSKEKTGLFKKDEGAMFGVLVCVDKSGRKVVLKSFNGAVGGISCVEGWCPPLGDLEKEAELAKKIEILLKRKEQAQTELEAKYRREIELLERQAKETAEKFKSELRRIGNLELNAEEWKKLGYESRPDLPPKTLSNRNKKEAPTDWEACEPYLRAEKQLYLPLFQESKNAAKDFEQRIKDVLKFRGEEMEKLPEVKALEEALEEQRANVLGELRKVENFKNEARPIQATCCPMSNRATNPRLGTCAAPKLFAEARRRGLIPVSLAEFWYGASTAKRKHLDFQQSCDYCRSLLGFTLCGLVEAQKSLHAELGEK